MYSTDVESKSSEYLNAVIDFYSKYGIETQQTISIESIVEEYEYEMRQMQEEVVFSSMIYLNR